MPSSALVTIYPLTSFRQVGSLGTNCHSTFLSNDI
jgi:hypothetical protein